MLVACSLVSGLWALTASGQGAGRRSTGEVIYRAPTPGVCDRSGNDTLRPPFQLWQLAEESFINQLDPAASRQAVWRDRRDSGLRSSNRIDGLYVFETREVILTPTTLVTDPPREPEGVPCRFLVTGLENEVTSRGIFQTMYGRGRIVAVRVGAVLTLAKGTPEKPSYGFERPYVVVDLKANASCYQVDPNSTEDDPLPATGYFFPTTRDGRRIVEPIKWCDPSELVDTTIEGTTDSRIPVDFQPLKELDQLRDIYNVMVFEHGLPGVAEMAFRCAKGHLEFWLRLDVEETAETEPETDAEQPDEPLPEPFKALLAHTVDVPHGCLGVEQITWHVEPKPGKIVVQVGGRTLSADTPWLDEREWKPVTTDGPGKAPKNGIETLYRSMTSQRPDLPILDDFRLNVDDQDGRKTLLVELSMRQADATSAELVYRLCAYMAATTEACIDIVELTCIGPDPIGSLTVPLYADLECKAAEMLKVLTAAGGAR